MEVKKYLDFVNEAKANKEEVIEALKDMFKSKPNVKMDTVPNEKGMYSIGGMKAHLNEKGFTNKQVDDALHTLMNDKKSGLETARVKIAQWNKTIPYWYIGLDKAEVDKLKDKYEAENLLKNKDKLEKEAEKKTAAKKAAEGKKKIKEDTKKAAAAKRATKKAEKPTDGAEKKTRTRKAPAKKTAAKK